VRIQQYSQLKASSHAGVTDHTLRTTLQHLGQRGEFRRVVAQAARQYSALQAVETSKALLLLGGLAIRYCVSR